MTLQIERHPSRGEIEFKLKNSRFELRFEMPTFGLHGCDGEMPEGPCPGFYGTVTTRARVEVHPQCRFQLYLHSHALGNRWDHHLVLYPPDSSPAVFAVYLGNSDAIRLHKAIRGWPEECKRLVARAATPTRGKRSSLAAAAAEG